MWSWLMSCRLLIGWHSSCRKKRTRLFVRPMKKSSRPRSFACFLWTIESLSYCTSPNFTWRDTTSYLAHPSWLRKKSCRDVLCQFDTTHSPWSESSAACPRLRGRRRGGEKFGPGAFATLERVVFSCKGAERDKWQGPKGRADALAVVVLWQKDDRVARTVGPSRRAHFRGVWSKTANSSPCRLAIGCCQGNQYVTLSSTVLLRTIAFQQAVLPYSRALTRCTIARKSLKMTDFSKTGSRNMAETRDFYSDRGSTATPFGHSNVRWCENFPPETTRCSFRVFFATLIAHGTKTRRARVLTFGTIGECPTMYSN